MFDWQRVHIIDELQRHGVAIDTFNPLYFYTPEEANESALNILRHGNYDLFLTNVCYHKMLFIDTIKEIKKMGVATLCLRCDNLTIPYNDKVLAPYFDLVWLTSKETRYLYDKWRVRSYFAPYAANPYTFNYKKQGIVRRSCFIGTPYGSRSIMINTLTCRGLDVDAYCMPDPNIKETKESRHRIVSGIVSQNKIAVYLSDLRFKEGRKALYGSLANKLSGNTKLIENKFLHEHYFIKPSCISNVYSKYALCLSSTSTNHTDALKNPLKIVNLRAFEVPMSGGINICRYNQELAEYFEDGKEIVFYQNNDELVDKVLYYTTKASDNELYSIKKAARLRAENEHTWWNRFYSAFEVLGLALKL